MLGKLKLLVIPVAATLATLHSFATPASQAIKCEAALIEEHPIIEISASSDLKETLTNLILQSATRHVDLDILQTLQNSVQPTIAEMSRILAQGTQASGGILQGEHGRTIIAQTEVLEKDLFNYTRVHNGNLRFMERLKSLMPSAISSEQKARIDRIQTKVSELQNLHLDVQTENYLLINIDQSLREHAEELNNLQFILKETYEHFSDLEVQRKFAEVNQGALTVVLEDCATQLQNISRLQNVVTGMITVIQNTLKLNRMAISGFNNFIQHDLLPISVISGHFSLLGTVTNTGNVTATTITAPNPPPRQPENNSQARFEKYVLTSDEKEKFESLKKVILNASSTDLTMVALKQIQELESPELVDWNARQLKKGGLRQLIGKQILEHNTDRRWYIDSSKIDSILINEYLADKNQEDTQLEKIQKYFVNKQISPELIEELLNLFLNEDLPLKNRSRILEILLVKPDFDIFRRITAQFKIEKGQGAITQFRDSLYKFEGYFPESPEYQAWREEIARAFSYLKSALTTSLQKESRENIELGRRGSFTKRKNGLFSSADILYMDEGAQELILSQSKDRSIWLYEFLASAKINFKYNNINSDLYRTRVFEAYEILKGEFPTNLSSKEVAKIVKIKRNNQSLSDNALLLALVQGNYPGVREMIDQEFTKKQIYHHDNAILLLARVLYDKYHGDDKNSASYREMFSAIKDSDLKFTSVRMLFNTVALNEGFGKIDSKNIFEVFSHTMYPFLKTEAINAVFQNKELRDLWIQTYLVKKVLKDYLYLNLDGYLLTFEIIQRFSPELFQDHLVSLRSWMDIYNVGIASINNSNSLVANTFDPTDHAQAYRNFLMKIDHKTVEYFKSANLKIPGVVDLLQLSASDFKTNERFYLNCLRRSILLKSEEISTVNLALQHLENLADAIEEQYHKSTILGELRSMQKSIAD